MFLSSLSMFRSSIDMNSNRHLIRPLKLKYLKHSLKIKHSLVVIRKSDCFAEDLSSW